MYIQHHFSKCCTRAKPFNFFHLFLAPSVPPDEMCFSPPEKQTSTRSARVGGGKHIPGCSSSLKPQMPPNPAMLPVLCTSAQHPGLVMQQREELDRVHSRVLNLISFPLWFQEAKHEGEVATPRAVQPFLCTYSKAGGLCTSPALQLPFSDKMLSRCCSQSQPRGSGADASQPSGNMPKPWHSALA